jgi:hypothetical protein
VVIRPRTFKKTRIAEKKLLFPLLEKTSVQFRGWDFPHLDHHNRPIIDLDWVGQECDYDDIIEVWRFYQSGQFIHISSIRYDWLDLSKWMRDWKPGTVVLGIGETIFRFTEIFEFGSRLALTDAGDDQMHIEITVRGLRNRALWVDNPNRMPVRQSYTATIEAFPYEIDLPRTELIAAPRELALKPAAELFQMFGWETTLEQLRSQQAELRK